MGLRCFLLLLIHRKQSLLGKSNLSLFTAFRSGLIGICWTQFYSNKGFDFARLWNERTAVNACFDSLLWREPSKHQLKDYHYTTTFLRLVRYYLSSYFSLPLRGRKPSRLYKGVKTTARVCFETMLASINIRLIRAFHLNVI